MKWFRSFCTWGIMVFWMVKFRDLLLAAARARIRGRAEERGGEGCG